MYEDWKAEYASVDGHTSMRTWTQAAEFGLVGFKEREG